MKKKFLLLLMLSAFIITGCNTNKKNDEATDNDTKTKLVENKDYSIESGVPDDCSKLKKRGYYINTFNQPNAPYYYIICMGEKNTDGYSLKVKEVNNIDDKTEIIVEEIVPSKNDKVTKELNYPTITIEFSNSQNIIIKNTDGEEYTELKD